jgi:hypothetical protein
VPTGLGWFASWAGLEVIPMLMLPLAIVMVALHRWLVQQPVFNDEPKFMKLE